VEDVLLKVERNGGEWMAVGEGEHEWGSCSPAPSKAGCGVAKCGAAAELIEHG
jgi:hypothetical protein